MKRLVLIHGYDGDPSRDWLPWMISKLADKKIPVIAPYLPQPTNPVLSEWLSTIDAAVGKPDTNTFFLAHSLGCLTLCRYLESLEANVKIGGVIFVAGSAGGTNIGLSNFDTSKIKPELILKHVNSENITQFWGTKDFIPKEKALKLGQLLKAKIIIVENAGHFSEDFDIFEVPEVFSEIQKMLNF